MLLTISALFWGLLFTPVIQCVPTGSRTEVLVSRAADHKGPGTKQDIIYCGGLNDPTIATTGDEVKGPGFWISNRDDSGENYFLYENSRDDHPWKYVMVSHTVFVSVCNTWQGRVVRGNPQTNMDGKIHNLGTWFQSNLDQNGWMWGAISFLQGCDGGGSVETSTEPKVVRLCAADDLLTGAPSSALTAKETGTKVLAKVVGDTPNQAAKDWELSKCNTSQIWISDANSGPVIKSTDGRLAFTFWKGKA
ncbi:hypothetical protein F5Y09DRAFT_353764 [Xylaria sp. FL1042]|nr:hypothetical protein F5Y09DRAFT_353764 [Xylaria sp. FL1042]